MNRSSARPGAAMNATLSSASASSKCLLGVMASFPPLLPPSLPQQLALDEGGCFRCRRAGEELGGRALLHQPAAMQEDDLVRQPPRLAQIMGRHDDLRAGEIDGGDDLLYRPRCRRIEARRWFVQEQHLRRRRPGARERQALLLAD